MKKLMWSALLGSVPVCAMYWVRRLSHNPGPPSGFWVDFTMFFFMPGYYFLIAIGGLLSSLQLGQKATITLIIVFACMFWSLVVLMLWTLMERLGKRPAAPVVHD